MRGFIVWINLELQRLFKGLPSSHFFNFKKYVPYILWIINLWIKFTIAKLNCFRPCILYCVVVQYPTHGWRKIWKYGWGKQCLKYFFSSRHFIWRKSLKQIRKRTRNDWDITHPSQGVPPPMQYVRPASAKKFTSLICAGGVKIRENMQILVSRTLRCLVMAAKNAHCFVSFRPARSTA